MIVAAAAALVLQASLYASPEWKPSEALTAVEAALSRCEIKNTVRLEPSGETPQDVAVAVTTSCLQQAQRLREAVLIEPGMPASIRSTFAETLIRRSNDGSATVVVELRACRKTPGCDPKTLYP